MFVKMLIATSIAALASCAFLAHVLSFRARYNPSTIIIAHRLKTIEHADTIAVVDGGVIIERGTHAQLLAQGGAYAQMVSKSRMAEAETHESDA